MWFVDRDGVRSTTEGAVFAPRDGGGGGVAAARGTSQGEIIAAKCKERIERMRTRCAADGMTVCGTPTCNVVFNGPDINDAAVIIVGGSCCDFYVPPNTSFEGVGGEPW